MKIIFCYLILLVIVHHADYVRGDCCHGTFRIVFGVEYFQDSTSCSVFDATLEDHQAGTCVIKDACANGKYRDGFFCGVGTCNMFGCNCDLGCIADREFPNVESIDPAEVAKKFVQLHKFKVYNVTASKNPWYKTSLTH